MRRSLFTQREAKYILTIAMLLIFGSVSALAQSKYRTFSQQALSEKKGRPGKSLGSKVCFTFTNGEGFDRYGVKAIISAPILAVLDSGGFTDVTITGKSRILIARGDNDTVHKNESVTICLLVQKKDAGTKANYWWWLNQQGRNTNDLAFLKLDATSDLQMYTQPNGGNVREYIYKKVVTRPAGVVIGIPRPDSAKFYGWIRFKTGDRKFFPDTGHARCFDYILTSNGTQKPFVKELKNPHTKKHNNHLKGEVHALKLAVVGNDARVTEPFDLSETRLGDLIYSDAGNPLDEYNGMTVRQLLLKADSVLTFCALFGTEVYSKLDSAISKINRAFDGEYYAISFNPFLLAGTHSLGEVPWLLPNPTASPIDINQVNGSILEQFPDGFQLRQNFPNPFNPTTTIEFNLGDDPVIVTLKVYNMLGQEVATLLNEEEIDGGEESVSFDASGLTSGVYLYKIYAKGVEEDSRYYQESKKMLLMR